MSNIPIVKVKSNCHRRNYILYVSSKIKKIYFLFFFLTAFLISNNEVCAKYCVCFYLKLMLNETEFYVYCLVMQRFFSIVYECLSSTYVYTASHRTAISFHSVDTLSAYTHIIFFYIKKSVCIHYNHITITFIGVIELRIKIFV